MYVSNQFRRRITRKKDYVCISWQGYYRIAIYSCNLYETKVTT